MLCTVSSGLLDCVFSFGFWGPREKFVHDLVYDDLVLLQRGILDHSLTHSNILHIIIIIFISIFVKEGALWFCFQSCVAMTSPPHINPENNQEIHLDVSEPWSGCQPIVDNVTKTYVVRCEATRSFRSARERWWYLAMARCQNTTIPVCLTWLLKDCCIVVLGVIWGDFTVISGYVDAIWSYMDTNCL